jgi:hypothetical protein
MTITLLTPLSLIPHELMLSLILFSVILALEFTRIEHSISPHWVGELTFFLAECLGSLDDSIHQLLLLVVELVKG